MALRASYKGFKKLLSPLKIIRPGIVTVDMDAVADDIINDSSSATNKTWSSSKLATVLNGVIANTQLIKDTVGWSGKNKLKITLAEVKANNTTGVWNGNAYTLNGVTATFAVDGDGNITNVALSNQASATTTITLKTNHVCDYILNNMILNGCAVGGSGSTFKLQIYDITGNTAYADFGSGIAIPSSVNGHTINAAIIVYSGNPTANINIKPMLRDANILDDTYEPYFGSTVETILSDHKTTINAIITAATGAADFAAFKTAMEAITPVARSLSLTKEDITDKVKEDEPEKTVTKKRTTKKTEEV